MWLPVPFVNYALIYMYFYCKCVTVVRSVIISSATCIRKCLVVNNVIITYTVVRSCSVAIGNSIHVHVVVVRQGAQC